MHTYLLFALLGASAVWATPLSVLAPRAVAFSIDTVSYYGSGCAQQNTESKVSSDGHSVKLTFQGFDAQAGPGIKATDWRKNCNIVLTISHPPGYRPFPDTETYRGFAEIAKGQTGTFEFGATELGAAASTHRIKGRYSSNYELEHTSQSGPTGNLVCLNNNKLTISLKTAINPTHLVGLLAVTEYDIPIKLLKCVL
ncbi:hypothetical protein TWF694_008907 [Orbilia ellipsospora]|uniref:Secreted protein n=1 Tax=Orbilia ellipsospora TaxID=2528407 RepID=A0AAV9XDE1_9PEZI